ncbi:MAG: hypothetical protein ACRDV3_18065 [Acidothermaceae bacterium]
MKTVAPKRPRWSWFLVWVVIGVGFGVGIAGALTIGIFVLPVVLAAAVIAGWRSGSAREVIGLLAGAGAPVFYIGWLNRDGPGMVCRNYPDGSGSCTQEWSPWPFAVVALAFVVLAFGIFVRSRRRERARPTVPPG